LIICALYLVVDNYLEKIYGDMALIEMVGNVTAKFPVPSGMSMPVAYKADTETVNVPSTESTVSGIGFEGCWPGST
jgi:hypothetical protein